MIRFKVFKLSQLVYTAVIAVLVILLIIVAVRLWQGSRPADAVQQPATVVLPAGDIQQPFAEQKEPFTAASFFNAVAQVVIPATPQPERTSVPSRGVREEAPESSETIMLTTPETTEPHNSDDETAEVFLITPGQTFSEDEHENEVLSEELQIQIAGISGQAELVSAPEGKPVVFIYHTHSREAFTATKAEPYKQTVAYRTLDTLHSVFRVGETLSDELAALGVRTIHDRTDHETPYRQSYSRSLDTLEKYIKEYPSLQVFVDVHRDGYEEGSRKQSDLTVTYNGKTYAKIMMVVGTGDNFAQKPNWKENYKVAKQITDAINAQIPGLAKPVLVKTGRYNQHISEQSLLAEVGSNLVSLESALNSAPILAKALATLVE